MGQLIFFDFTLKDTPITKADFHEIIVFFFPSAIGL